MGSEVSSSKPEYDVLVIGAGISGLTAAYNIKKRHPFASVLVLEANDRVGGRTQTVPLAAASGSDKWDVGGQWVGKCQIHIMKLLEELNLETFRQHSEGRSLQQIGGNKVKSFKGTIPALSIVELIDLYVSMYKTHRRSNQIDVNNPYNHHKAAEWDAMSVASFFDKVLYTKGARETNDAALRTVFGAETSQISFLYYLLYIREAGNLDKLIEDSEYSAQEARIKLGAQQISHELTSLIGSDNVKLNEAVSAISQNDAGVLVATESGWKSTASRVILAMPPKAIEKITFTPRLPQDRLDFMKRMPMGSYTKVIVTYEQAFWRSKGLSGMAVSSGHPVSEDGLPAPFSVVYDAVSTNGNPALLGFLSGKMAVEWATRPAKERQNAVLHHLATLFGQEALSFLDYLEKDWNQEPFAHGGPVSYMGVGGMDNFSKTVRRVEGRLHFAGTETATVWTGYMSGAVQAGERAAVEVLSHIQPKSLSEEDMQLLTELDNANKNMSRKIKPKKSCLIGSMFSIGLGVAMISCAMYSVSYYLDNEIEKVIAFP